MDPKKPKDLPFYETPDHVKTSAKIISEAKSQLVRAQLKPIGTKRPVTPQEGGRKLFGEESIRDPSNRPPSAFSLGSRHFDSDSRPLSGTRLLPLDHKPKSDNESVKAPRPPTDPNRPISRKGSRHRLQQSNSQDVSSNGLESMKARSGSLQDVHSETDRKGGKTSSVPTTPEGGRRVHSGPKERTKNLLEERGIGDGREAEPRVESRAGYRRSAEGRRERPEHGTDRAESGYGSETREGSASSQRMGSAGKGSAGRREDESPEEAYYFNTRVASIFEEMTTHTKDKDPEKLGSLADDLYDVLEEGNMLGKACKRRSTILKTIFRLLDLESPQILLKLARLILALKISGNNLTNVCKLVFKVSRDEKNDKYFMHGNILELMVDTVQSADHLTSSDALIYAVGSLKFLSGNSTLLKGLHKRGCFEALSRILISINKTNNEAGKAGETQGHVLVQLTACLRNLADVSGAKTLFLQEGVITELCTVMENYQTDADLMLNISRIFSKLTMHSDCCNVIAAQASHFKSIVHLLKIYQRREDLILRMSFILGNLMAKSDLSRNRFFQQSKGFDILLSVFKYYLDLYQKSRDPNADRKSPETKQASKIEDVLIKVVRVIANLSINEEIGSTIASNDSCIQLLITVLEIDHGSNNEELVLNTIATVNNLSFYNTKHSAVVKRQLKIAECLLRFLEVDNIEGLAEATRVFGNLSRDKSVRDFLVKHKVDEMMVILLDSGKLEIVFTAVGVLINLMADDEKRRFLKKTGGVSRLIEVMRDFGRSDWQLASMVCQTLWNYSGKITSATACFGDPEAENLTDILIEYLDEEAALDASLNPDFDEEMLDFVRETWEAEFCPVANQLLHRIESHTSNFEPLEGPS